MTFRANVNLNNFSTPFSTQASTIGARNEERRLERIYGQPEQRKTTREQLQDDVRVYRQGKRNEALDLAHLSTETSNAKVTFAGRQYTLPPVKGQKYGLLEGYGDFDAHFRGLGISKKEISWLNEADQRVLDHNWAASGYNEFAKKKASGGLFRRKSIAPVEVPEFCTLDLDPVFNRKLAEARIPVRIVRSEDHEPYLMHPSSESGNLLAEMKIWADEHWRDVPEKAWTDSMPEFPKLTKKTKFTESDAQNLQKMWSNLKHS